MMDALGRLGVHLPSLGIYTLNFLFLWAVLHLLVFRPFLIRLRQRETQAQEAALEEQRRTHLLQEAEEARRRLLAQGREEYAAILRQAEDIAKRYAAESREKTEAQAGKLLEQARAGGEEEMARAWDEMRDAFAELLVALSERALMRGLTEEEQHALIADGLSQLAALGWSPGANAPTAYGQVTTALPLLNDEKAGVERFLKETTGRPVRLEYTVDPSATGGIAMQVGDTLLDATVRGRLRRLRVHLRS